MNSYRAFKAKEVELALTALQDRLDKCPRQNNLHSVVLGKLEGLLAVLAQELVIISPVIHDPAFRPLVDARINRISIFLFLVERQYLRALSTPSPEELFLRGILINCAKRLGLDWIEDLVVQGSGELAIYPEFAGSLTTPAFHVPTGLLDSFLALPGIYHEFGHSVFRKFPSLLTAMKDVCKAYFDDLARRLGPMQPNLRDAQLKRFKKAHDFWSDRRLEELFCDLFAQYIGGCANVISMIDLSMAQGRPTFEMENQDYPADAARVRACELALNAQQSADPQTRDLMIEWEEYAQRFTDSQFYHDACPKELLRQLGEVVFTKLGTELPKLPRLTLPPPDVNVAFTPVKQTTLEDAIQQGMSVLSWRRDNFDSWWEDVVKRLI
jgi:hypothetical protein